jgi:predicted phage terminase large subunit-like protein
VFTPNDTLSSAETFLEWLKSGKAMVTRNVGDTVKQRIANLDGFQREFLKGAWKEAGLPKVELLTEDSLETVNSLIVEAKAAGSPLIFELRAMGIPVQEFTPSKGNDKIARLNAVADMFASGHVWVPNTHWAEELVEEVASFPSGEHDDLVDSMTQALLRYRRGGFIQLASDEEDEPRQFRRKEPYY